MPPAAGSPPANPGPSSGYASFPPPPSGRFGHAFERLRGLGVLLPAGHPFPTPKKIREITRIATSAAATMMTALLTPSGGYLGPITASVRIRAIQITEYAIRTFATVFTVSTLLGGSPRF